MKKFLKDTRGVVMMEYVLLGCFAVAVTAVAVLALGKAYGNGLTVMANATVGNTAIAGSIAANSKVIVADDLIDAVAYATNVEDTSTAVGPTVEESQFNYTVYNN